jgi:uncharacterized membrane protein YfcA
MALGLASLLIFAALVTAFISGIFGLAGGMLLMGLLTLVLPVEAAFVTHGIVQLVANGWRAILHREFVKLQILGWFALATAAAASVMILIGFVPPKALIFTLMGLLPILLWLPRNWFTPDASRPSVALSSGFLAGLFNLTAGVSGPLIDTVFVRTGLNRHQIVATKGAIQTLNHVAKIGVFGLLLAHGGNGDTGLPPYWFFMLVIPASMLGTTAGGWVLDRLSDANFKRWTAWIVTVIGVFYLWKAWDLWF